MAERPDYYAVLGVPRDATMDEIRRAYRREARLHHPDLVHDDPRATEMFRRIQGAYDILSDPALRKRYDEGGEVRFGASAAVAVIRDVFRTMVRDHLRNARRHKEGL